MLHQFITRLKIYFAFITTQCGIALLFTLFDWLVILFYNVFKLANVYTIWMRHSSLFSRLFNFTLLFLRQLLFSWRAIICLFCFFFLIRDYFDFFRLFWFRLINLFFLPFRYLFLPYFLSLFFFLLSLLFFFFFLFVSHFFNLSQYDLLCFIFLIFFLFVFLFCFPAPVIKILLFLFRVCFFRFLNLFLHLLFLLCYSNGFFSWLGLVYKLLGLIIKWHFFFQQFHLILVFFALKMILKLPFLFKSLAADLTCKLINDNFLVNTVFLIFFYLFCELFPVLTQSFLLKKSFFLFGFFKFLLFLLFNQ